MRGGDLLARFGGEEFLYVLPDTDIQGAWAVAKRAMDAVRQLRVTKDDGQPASPVTVSMGLACTEIDVVAGPEPLVALADQRLYFSKESGRDRCSGPSA
jgi:diguanylate cyclase (GGDEF)-like protein